MSISALLVLAFICVTSCHSPYQTTLYETRTNSSPGIATNNSLMSAFESSSNVIPYYLQGHLAASIEHTTVFEIVQNIRVLNWPFDISYPAAKLNNLCKSTPNILGLEEQVPEMITYLNILPPGLYSKQYRSNLLPNIGKNNGLMTDFESPPKEIPYYQQGIAADGIVPTTTSETNPNAKGYSIPYGSFYPEAGSNVMCGSTPNMLGIEGLVPEVNKYPNIYPSGLYSKQNKSNILPGIITRKALMPPFEFSPSKNPYYLQGHSAAGIAPTKIRETNPNADRLSMPYGSSYPEAGSNVVCESTPNILGLDGIVREVIKHPNNIPSGLYSKKYKSNSLPGIVTILIIFLKNSFKL